MPSTITVVGGWTVVIGVVATVWYFNSKHKGRRAIHSKQLGKPLVSRRDGKQRRTRPEGGQSSGDQDPGVKEKIQRKRIQSSKNDGDARVDPVPEAKHDDGDDEVDNREFARQLSSAKAGTLLPSKTSEGPRKKSVKQSRAQEKLIPVETSSDNYEAHSSATGGDADDDQSSINSPDPINSGDVSDMLEAPAPGPSVLRVTEPTNPDPPTKAKPQTNFEPAQTKKQRQNAKKAQAQKMAREEDEKERKRLLEQQRRTVREAEGRPAKDGSIFMASQAPANNAWAKPVGDTKTNGDSSGKKVELLDTFEPSTSTTASALPANKNTNHLTSDVSASEAEVSSNLDENYSQSEIMGDEWSKLPSEEEQIRFSIEESKNWQLVQAKEKRNKKMKEAAQETKEQKEPKTSKATNDAKGTKEITQEFKSAQNDQDKDGSEDDQEDYAPPKLRAPTGPGQKWETTLTYVENGKVVEKTVTRQDSEWEVA